MFSQTFSISGTTSSRILAIKCNSCFCAFLFCSIKLLAVLLFKYTVTPKKGITPPITKTSIIFPLNRIFLNNLVLQLLFTSILHAANRLRLHYILKRNCCGSRIALPDKDVTFVVIFRIYVSSCAYGSSGSISIIFSNELYRIAVLSGDRFSVVTYKFTLFTVFGSNGTLNFTFQRKFPVLYFRSCFTFPSKSSVIPSIDK